MTRSELLPAEVIDWLRDIPQDEMRRRLANAIAERATTAGLSLDGRGLPEQIEALDTRYFDAQDDGREEAAMGFFMRARLLSAQCFLLDGRDEDALYEFFHSLDDITPTSLIAALPIG